MLQAYSLDTSPMAESMLAKLPLDLVIDITDYLTRREVYFLSIASPATSRKLDQFAFWRRRIKRSMPWLWDLDPDALPDDLNWRYVYHDLQEKCTYSSLRRVLCLVNRKSLWDSYLSLAEIYRRRCLEKAELDLDAAEVMGEEMEMRIEPPII